MQPRLVLAFVALLLLTAFTEPDKRFTIDFPSGWTAPEADKDGNWQADAPKGANRAWCRANSNKMPTLETSQAVLNSTYGAPLDRKTWSDVITVDAAKIPAISDGSARIVDGHVVQLVTITFAPEVMGMGVKGRFVSHILTGRMVNAACFAPSEGFDRMKAEFEKTVTSLKPL